MKIFFNMILNEEKNFLNSTYNMDIHLAALTITVLKQNGRFIFSFL